MFSPVARLGRAWGDRPRAQTGSRAAEVSSRRNFLLPRPTAVHSPEGRKFLMLVELPPTREPTPSLRVRRRPFPIDEPGGVGGNRVELTYPRLVNGSVAPGLEARVRSSERSSPRKNEQDAHVFREVACYRPPAVFYLEGARRLAGGRSRVAVALEDSVQMLLELPPTREPTSFGKGEPKALSDRRAGGSGEIEAS